MLETLLSFSVFDFLPLKSLLGGLAPVKSAISASLFLLLAALLLCLRFLWVRLVYSILLKLLPLQPSLFDRLFRRVARKTPQELSARHKEVFGYLRQDMKSLSRWLITCLTLYCLGAAVFSLPLIGYIALYNKVFVTVAIITLVPWFRKLIPHLVDCYLVRYSHVELTLAATIAKISSFLVVLSVIIILLEFWGIAVAPIITGLGIFGVALALGAQDLFRNIIAGLTILAEKRFDLGDVIELNTEIFGTVEAIGFRTTQIRRFDDHLVYTPNATLADQSLINVSRRGSFRLNWQIGLEYATPQATLVRICRQIQELLNKHPEVIANAIIPESQTVAPQKAPGEIPEAAALPDKTADKNPGQVGATDKGYVHVSGFAPSSIDIMIYCYFATNLWARWLALREEIALGIMRIVNDSDASFAFPSQTVYLRQENGAGDDSADPASA